MHPTAKRLAAILLIAGCGGPSGDGPAPVPNNNPGGGDPVQLKVMDFDKITALIKSHKGKVVVVDFWAMT